VIPSNNLLNIFCQCVSPNPLLTFQLYFLCKECLLMNSYKSYTLWLLVLSLSPSPQRLYKDLLCFLRFPLYLFLVYGTKFVYAIALCAVCELKFFNSRKCLAICPNITFYSIPAFFKLFGLIIFTFKNYSGPQITFVSIHPSIHIRIHTCIRLKLKWRKA
jgi:hypothetical protein